MTMNMQGLDYNTQRPKLHLPEYGREIQKMVEHAMSIADRSERQHCAESIVATMQRMFSNVGGNDLNKYWDHLAVMSDFKLDVDYPFDIEKAKDIMTKPASLPYPKKNIRVRHYGAMVDEIFDKLKTMPEGDERNKLVQIAAQHMKACLLEYSRGTVDDKKVADDLAYYTDGKIQVDPASFKFAGIQPNRVASDNKKKRNRQ